MSRHHTTGQNHYMKVANKSFESVAKLRYLESKETHQNPLTRKLGSYEVRIMLATMQTRIFFLLVRYLET
jgi:hypothetical protein